MAKSFSAPFSGGTEASNLNLLLACRLLGRFWTFVRPYRGKFYLGLCLILIAVPLNQLALFLTRDVTNKALSSSALTTDQRWSTVIHIVGLQIVFYLASAVLSTWREVLEWYGGMRSTLDLRLAFYKHLHRLPLSFLNSRPPGEHLFRSTTDMTSMFLVRGRVAVPGAAGQSPPDSKEVAMAAYSNDVDPYDPGIMGMIVRTVPMIFETLYALAWGLGLLFLIDPILSLCLLIYIVPFTFLSARMFDKIRRTAFAYKEAGENEIAVLRDSVGGLRTLKAFGRLTEQLRKYVHAATVTRRRAIRQAYEIVLTQNVLQMGLKWIFSLTVYGYVTVRVMKGQASVGDWVATFLLIDSAQAPLENFVQLTQLTKMQLVPAQRILHTLDVQPTLLDRPHAVRLPRIEGRIGFHGVTFGYSPEQPVLHNLELTVEPGEYIGVVGPSGAGKSSLIALLLRHYQANSGKVTVDGEDLLDVKLLSFLDQVGAVPQTTFLYSGAIAENILFGNPFATLEDLEAAAKVSGVSRFASQLTNGLLTEVGEAGLISGGERQRIGIARALIRDPRILILDEATASLDPETEEAILGSIDLLRNGRTVLSVAHRLKAVQHCDRIVVMDQGRIVQIGKHEQLVVEPGLYQSLWNEQTRDLGMLAEADR
ncbi:MAG TPA: ABC transporter ATP-binding protein [Fimbriimonas sp.]|nr:ABC transporter ATP-binding protein [Fimbriimonas sp.]